MTTTTRPCPYSVYDYLCGDYPDCEACHIYQALKQKASEDKEQREENGICLYCGAQRQNYREAMGRECWEEHGAISLAEWRGAEKIEIIPIPNTLDKEGDDLFKTISDAGWRKEV